MPNILRSKGNQTMKMGQLIEYKIRNIFLKNHTQNVVEKLVPYLSIKKTKSSISMNQQTELLKSLFLPLPYIKPFKKRKRCPELVSLRHFLREFWRKIFLTI